MLYFNFTEKSLFIKGETKTICCTSDSNPSTVTMWMKNQKISKEVHHKHNVCLTLMNISGSDGGIYSCFAGNKIGFVEQETNINVLCKKHFNKALLLIFVYRRRRYIAFFCNV